MTAPPPAYEDTEDKIMPVVVYVLYLLGLINGLTILIGLIIAYANKDSAGPRMASHYIFQIRTVWTALAWWMIGGVLLFWGIPLSFILVGAPLVVIAGCIFALTHIWFFVRNVVGLVHASRGDAYPRPRAWLL